jgi:hypothetical protein
VWQQHPVGPHGSTPVQRLQLRRRVQERTATHQRGRPEPQSPPRQHGRKLQCDLLADAASRWLNDTVPTPNLPCPANSPYSTLKAENSNLESPARSMATEPQLFPPLGCLGNGVAEPEYNLQHSDQVFPPPPRHSRAVAVRATGRPSQDHSHTSSQPDSTTPDQKAETSVELPQVNMVFFTDCEPVAPKRVANPLSGKRNAADECRTAHMPVPAYSLAPLPQEGDDQGKDEGECMVCSKGDHAEELVICEELVMCERTVHSFLHGWHVATTSTARG